MTNLNSLNVALYSFLICLLLTSGAAASTPDKAEIHEFHVLGEVHYRCYAGYQGKKVVDERTNEPCDNKDYKKVIVDKFVALRIANEPTPDNSKELVGVWRETFEFKKRKFEIAISLFKNESHNSYRIRVVATDDEPTPRQTAVFSKMKSMGEMNPLEIQYSSAGKKEEITFSTSVESKPKK